jgi:hypothetical protein
MAGRDRSWRIQVGTLDGIEPVQLVPEMIFDDGVVRVSGGHRGEGVGPLLHDDDTPYEP